MTKLKKKGEKKSNAVAVMLQRIVMLIFLMFGLTLLLYPILSQSINDYLDQKIVQSYQKEASKKNKAEIARIQKEMDERNEKAKKEKNPGSDGEPFSEARRNKEKKVKPTPSYIEQHTAGTVVIPKIDVKLPIFDVTNEFFLSKGAAILESTSSLKGGPGSHSVISSHRGLREAKLFTDLPKLESKDLFFIEVLDETHAYEVDQVKVIEPTETRDLLIAEGMDYVTLLTCTPYGVNSHRLLVRGHRVPYTKKIAKEKAAVDNRKQWKQLGVLIAAIIGSLLLLGLFCYIIRLGMIGLRKYQLIFYLIDQQTKVPITGQKIQMTGKKGKNPVLVEGQPVIETTDEEGKVEFPAVFGKTYGIKLEGQPKIFARTKVKKIKGHTFSLKPRSKQYTIQQTDRLLVLTATKG
ncbi:class C sortase [Enterococcus florum]|uniref:Class C sortase n=1 Tax=Enterococcus florum TaxID=2480627 RepID=A0A4P5PBY7_9ENTE|nr:class C sortase [Enterococcus florum]GCF93801.1 class C sortase [Enterococcus florum]